MHRPGISPDLPAGTELPSALLLQRCRADVAFSGSTSALGSLLNHRHKPGHPLQALPYQRWPIWPPFALFLGLISQFSPKLMLGMNLLIGPPPVPTNASSLPHGLQDYVSHSH